jgi:hypothetical protein
MVTPSERKCSYCFTLRIAFCSLTLYIDVHFPTVTFGPSGNLACDLSQSWALRELGVSG